MSSVSASLRIAHDAVNHVVEADDWGEHDWIALRNLADHYRILVDNSKELFKAELPEHVAQYIIGDAHFKLVEYPEQNDVQPYVVRDAVGFYRDWAFFNGFRNANPERQTVDLTGYKDDHTFPLLKSLNRRIDNDMASPQDAYAGLKLAHLAFDKSRDGWQLDSEQDAMDVITEISDIVAEMVERAEDNSDEKPFDYNKLGGTLDFTYNELHHKGLERTAKRKLARQIRDGETTAEAFLDD